MYFNRVSHFPIDFTSGSYSFWGLILDIGGCRNDIYLEIWIYVRLSLRRSEGRIGGEGGHINKFGKSRPKSLSEEYICGRVCEQYGSPGSYLTGPFLQFYTWGTPIYLSAVYIPSLRPCVNLFIAFTHNSHILWK